MYQKRIITILSLTLLFISCEKSQQSTIPDVRISFSCNMVQSEFAAIQIPGQFVKVTRDNHNLNVGFGGLIIGQSVYPDNGFCTYDAACPVESDQKITVNILNTGLSGAVCPSCGTTYNLSNFGFSNEKDREPLKRYRVTVSGNTLHVNN